MPDHPPLSGLPPFVKAFGLSVSLAFSVALFSQGALAQQDAAPDAAPGVVPDVAAESQDAADAADGDAVDETPPPRPVAELRDILTSSTDPALIAAARDEMRIRADEGNLNAYVFLAESLAGEDPGQAVTLYELAAAEGNTLARVQLAQLLEGGAGAVPADLARARGLYAAAAADGSPGAAMAFARMASAGEGGPQDFAAAIDAYDSVMAGDNERLAGQATLTVIRGHLSGNFGDASDLRLGAGMAAEFLSENEDASLAWQVLRQAGDISAAGGSVDVALGVLERAAEAGDETAPQRLAAYWQRDPGAARPEATARLSGLVARHGDMLNPRIVARTVVQSQARQARNTAAYATIAEAVWAAPTASLRMLRWENANAYTYAVQVKLQELGLYSGALNGLMTTSTIRAISAYCARAGISAQCLRGPLHGDTVQAIAVSLEPEAG